mmetsp:Transcript_68744/g.182835  ORF Transcript_68744/g.182835 Transcript_68744/m.182835 type:complete len:240 (-) Transcript_68744:1047-1766(-)
MSSQVCLILPQYVGTAAPHLAHMSPMQRGQRTEIRSMRSGMILVFLLGPAMALAYRSPREFVPPKPKEETPQYPEFSSVWTISTSKSCGKPADSKWGFKARRCTFGVAHECRRMTRHLSTPAIPAADSKCAMLLLALVWGSGSSRSPSMTAMRAPTSMGSPSAVPVPWHSTQVMESGSIPANFRDHRRTACCDGPLGAVKLALRPSWLAQLPAKTANRSCRSLYSALSFPYRNAVPSPR